MQPVTRSAWSCEACRRRKVRCDSQQPSCAHCVRRAEVCKWPRSPARQANLQSHIERLERIEAVLEGAGLLQLGRPSQTQTHIRSDAQTQLPAAEPAKDNGPTDQEPDIEELADARHGDELHHEVHRHDGFDHHIIGASPSQFRAHGDHGRRAPAPAKQSEVRHILARTLPVRQRCDELLQSYLLNVEWIHHPLNVPSFQAEYVSFWRTQSTSNSPDMDLQWLALLMIVLCLGSHFHPQQQPVKHEEDMYTASQELLLLSDHLARHSITAIQTLILMGLWLNNRGRSNIHHAQLALAIKMAVSLGLSRVDAKTSRTKASDDDAFFAVPIITMPPQHTVDADSELKRRIWWSLVCQDYYTASSCNFTYSIHPSQSKTDLFQNIDDQMLSSTAAPNAPLPLPLNALATSSSFQLLKISFARVAKAMTDLYNDDELSYDAVLRLEQHLWETYENLPEFFKWQTGHAEPMAMPASAYVSIEHLQWQRLFLGFTVHNRVLRLHRPFMAQGYSDSSKVRSRQSTIKSAIACIALAEEGRTINFPGLRWWVVLIHIFTAGVALCIDYHYLLRFQRQATSTTDLSQLTRSRRDQISRTLKLLRPAEQSSLAAARAIAVLSSLVRQAETAQTGTIGTEMSSEQLVVQPVSPSTTSAITPSAKRRRETTISHSDAVLASADATAWKPISAYVSDSSISQPLDNDWLALTDMDVWTGPDWDLLFGSFSHEYDVHENLSAELHETISSFALGFDFEPA